MSGEGFRFKVHRVFSRMYSSARHLKPKKINPTQNTNNFPSAVQLHFLRFTSSSISRKAAFATCVHDSRNYRLRMSYCFLCSFQNNPHRKNESSRSRQLRPTYPQGLALFTVCYYRDLKHSACVSTWRNSSKVVHHPFPPLYDRRSVTVRLSIPASYRWDILRSLTILIYHMTNWLFISSNATSRCSGKIGSRAACWWLQKIQVYRRDILADAIVL